MADISQFNITTFQDASNHWWASFTRKDGAAITFEGTTMLTFKTSHGTTDQADANNLAIKTIRAIR